MPSTVSQWIAEVSPMVRAQRRFRREYFGQLLAEIQSLPAGSQQAMLLLLPAHLKDLVEHPNGREEHEIPGWGEVHLLEALVLQFQDADTLRGRVWQIRSRFRNLVGRRLSTTSRHFSLEFKE